MAYQYQDLSPLFNCIQRTDDAGGVVFIPKDDSNADYMEFLSPSPEVDIPALDYLPKENTNFEEE